MPDLHSIGGGTDRLRIFAGGCAGIYPPRPRRTCEVVNADSYAESVSMYERALALDPRSVEAQAWLAIALTGRVLDNMTETAAVDLTRAEALASQVLVAAPRSGHAHYDKGQVLRAAPIR